MKTALLILALHSMLSAQTQSLADVARQERARQKNTKSDTTITNETLGTAAGEPESAANKTGAESVKSPATEPAATEAVRDEAWWREAFTKAREEVQRNEDRSKVLQLELNRLNMDLLTRSDIYNREGVLAPLLADKNAELAAAEKATDQARQNVTKLEDDLRRSGAPAGWKR